MYTDPDRNSNLEFYAFRFKCMLHIAFTLEQNDALSTDESEIEWNSQDQDSDGEKGTTDMGANVKFIVNISCIQQFVPTRCLLCVTCIH